MRLDENFTLEGESYNWTLKLRKDTGVLNEKTGRNVVEKGHWYYPSLESALNKYVNEVVKPSPTVEAILAKLEEITATIESIRVK